MRPARHGANEARLARVVAERAANRADRLTQRAVGDDDIVPDAIEDIAAVQRLVTTLDQEDEEVEVARDERQLEPVTDEKPSSLQQLRALRSRFAACAFDDLYARWVHSGDSSIWSNEVASAAPPPCALQVHELGIRYDELRTAKRAPCHESQVT